MSAVKKKRVSKKNKKSWRKNVDWKDVDEFLEDQRLDERLGKVSTKKNDELFVIDSEGKHAPSTEPTSKIKYNVKPVGQISTYRLTQAELPKCYSILGKRSSVPDPVIKRNHLKSIGKRHTDVKKERMEKGILTSHQREAMRCKEVSRKRKEDESKIGEFSTDAWAETDEQVLEGCDYWLRKDTIRHNLHNTGQLKKHMPKLLLKKSSLIPAVEAPHPGLSYNPSIKDYHQVLTSVVGKEKELVKEEKHIKRVTTHMFRKLKREDAEKNWLHEMSSGLKQASDSSDVEGDYTTVNPPVKNKKKTLKKRRKLREARELKENLKKRKVEKRKISDTYKLKHYQKFFDKKEQESQKLTEKKKKQREQKPFTTRVLSRLKFEEPEIEFNNPSDLKGNLRGMKAEGNLLMDRYKSLQKRNVLEPAMKRLVKKRKMKKYERSSTKMGFEPKGY